MSAAACPSDHELQNLLLGLLSEEASLLVERHLEGCADCATRLARLPLQDPLLKDVRVVAGKGSPVPAGPDLSELSLRLKAFAFKPPPDVTGPLHPPTPPEPAPLPPAELGMLGVYR